MTKVKICGITNLEDARHAVACGADMLGFNFYRRSKRYVEPATAAEIVAGLDGLVVGKVGVFVNADIAEIAEIADQIGLDAIQLHGDENEQFVKDVQQETDKYIIKAVRLKGGEAFLASIETRADALLFDSFARDSYGGNGETFDWNLASDISISLCEAFVAGGLNQMNVAEAVQLFRPYAVDVASGVESSPGKKDPAKVAAFIKAAKEAL